jgi:tetratricopeptide (TPR) repeat protein
MRLLFAAAMALLVGTAASATAADLDPTPEGLVNGAEVIIQQVRDGADPAALDQAEDLYEQLLDSDAADAAALTGLGVIALSRHRFSDALELGQQASAIDPASARPLGVMVDALIELGRYDEAESALDAMLKARPDLASFSRLSYFHELHGDLESAIDAMELAVIAGGAAVENTEFARVKLADLWLLSGHADRAGDLYRTALDQVPGYVPAIHGLARVALADADVAEAERQLLEAISAAALPESLVQLGALQEAAGETALAEATFASAAALERFHRQGSSVPEPFGAVMEADHGDPAAALEVARQVYASSASIGAADALAWALHANGRSAEALKKAREALRTGSHDPSILYHAGVIAADTGDDAVAQRWLGQALASSDAGPAMLRAAVEAALADL